MKRSEKIAILMASYNGEKFIAAQMDSILRQSEKDWILYIHDDGSADQTNHIIDSYCKKYPEQIIKMAGRPTGSAKDNFLYLMKNVDAPYLMFCDQDDIWVEDKIATTLEAMKNTENRETTVPVLVYTDLTVIDEKENEIAHRLSSYQQLDMEAKDILHLLMQNIVTGCTVMINRALKEKALLVEDSYHMIMHDWWLALCASYFGKITYIDQPLILYRQHVTNSVGAKNPYSPAYFCKKLRSGKETKKVFEQTRAQARLFKDTYSLSSQTIIAQYGNLSFHTKVARWAFYTKYHLWRKPWVRKLTQIIYG